MDHWYLTRAERKKGNNPMIVVVDAGNTNVATVAVGHTGNQAWVTKHVADDHELGICDKTGDAV